MRRFFFLVVVCIAFSSCAPSTYYQLYQTQPISDIAMRENCMVFEDENCEIIYNFWKEYGEIGFVFYNKTTENIYLHLDECFYVENGIAYDYYQNRIYTNSKAYVTSSQLTNIYGSYNIKSNTYRNGYINSLTGNVTSNSSNSVSIAEKQVICIPPKSSKTITEFDIKNSVYRSCDLYRIPALKKPHGVSFNIGDSPLIFGNKIAYSIGKNEEIVRVNNEFYVSKISNYSPSDIIRMEYVEECGKKTYEQVRVFNESGPNQFFIPYIPNDGKKH